MRTTSAIWRHRYYSMISGEVTAVSAKIRQDMERNVDNSMNIIIAFNFLGVNSPQLAACPVITAYLSYRRKPVSMKAGLDAGSGPA